MTDPKQTKSPNHNAKMTLTLSNKAIVRKFNFSNTLCIERSERDQKKKPDSFTQSDVEPMSRIVLN